MAETPADQTQTQSETEVPAGSDPNSSQYWCYHCDKRVSIETLADLPAVICHECKTGFVESIGPPAAPAAFSDEDDENEFEAIRLIVQAARDGYSSSPPLSQYASDDDGYSSSPPHSHYASDDDGYSPSPPLSQYASDVDEDDEMDAVRYDSNGRRGARPASRAAVEALETMEIMSEQEALACAVCQDIVGVGEIIKKLPCGHWYRGECIVRWLRSSNSCPVCRSELPTDDAEYASDDDEDDENEIEARNEDEDEDWPSSPLSQYASDDDEDDGNEIEARKGGRKLP